MVHGLLGTDDQAQLDSDAPLDALELYLSLKAYAPKGVETDNSSEVRDALMQGKNSLEARITSIFQVIPSFSRPHGIPFR